MRKQNWNLYKNEDKTYTYKDFKTLELVHSVDFDDLHSYYKEKAINMSWIFNGGTCTMHTGKDINSQRNLITGKTREVYCDSGRVVSR